MPILTPLLDIASRTKSFDGPLLGSPLLNRLGLHLARIAVTDVLLALRRLELAPMGLSVAASLRRDGIAVVPGILPEPVFAAVRDEVHAAVAATRARYPLPVNDQHGFGEKMPFEGGFDRFDGGTLNRFLDIDARRLPATAAAVRQPALAQACRMASGFLHHPARFQVYQTVHGDERANPDIQRAIHRDTFHSTIKLWLFLDEVTEAHGPFLYSPGSHRMTAARCRWEHARALAATRPGSVDRGGSFRINEQELAALGMPPVQPYPVAPNTLVIADVRGFHARGHAAPGAERLALYANLRLWPFTPLPY